MISDYSANELVERAVRAARPHRTTEAPRWVAVSDVFCLGSQSAMDLCRELCLDPCERVPGVPSSCQDEEGGSK